jgi:hypothetical protein
MKSPFLGDFLNLNPHQLISWIFLPCQGQNNLLCQKSLLHPDPSYFLKLTKSAIHSKPYN